MSAKNGNKLFRVIKNKDYKFDLAVQAGKIDDIFESSDKEKAIPVKVKLQYGSIEKLD